MEIKDYRNSNDSNDIQLVASAAARTYNDRERQRG